MSEGTFRLIAIAGLSGSGKTTLARRLASRLDAPILSTDDYYRPLTGFSMEERQAANYDSPDIIDFELLDDHIRQLAAGEPIQKPMYDFVEFTRAPESQLFHPAPWMILEGLFALRATSVQEHAACRVFLKVEPNVCLARRTERDVRERNRTPEEVHWRFHTHVLPQYREHGAPLEALADVLLEADYSPREAEEKVFENLMKVATR